MSKSSEQRKKEFSGLLLNWFDREKRDLPWRRERTPYKVLLSEFMLQQTQVETVIPYFEKFLKLWPNLTALSLASTDDVRGAWAGLGYYRRAENLLRAARAVQEKYGGVLPRTKAQLQELPGIGPYTAAAVSSMAYGEPEPAVDGNLLRVLSRVFEIPWQAGRSKDIKEAETLARQFIPPDRPGDFNEALMDLSSALCKPSRVSCTDCPLAPICAASTDCDPLRYPLKAERGKVKELRRPYLILRTGGKICLRRRSERLLKDFYEFIPLSDDFDPDQPICFGNGEPHRVSFLTSFRHVFSHRVWQVELYELSLDEADWPLGFAESGSKEENNALIWNFFQNSRPVSEKISHPLLSPEEGTNTLQTSWHEDFQEISELLAPFLRRFVDTSSLC